MAWSGLGGDSSVRNPMDAGHVVKVGRSTTLIEALCSEAVGNKEDKPAWWPRRPKWKHFRGPSRASKEETTILIRLLLEHYNVDPDIHYVGYPEEEDDSSSEESSDEDDDAINDAREDEEQDPGEEKEEVEEEHGKLR